MLHRPVLRAHVRRRRCGARAVVRAGRCDGNMRGISVETSMKTSMKTSVKTSMKTFVKTLVETPWPQA
jgi:hypothetical protein